MITEMGKIRITTQQMKNSLSNVDLSVQDKGKRAVASHTHTHTKIMNFQRAVVRKRQSYCKHNDVIMRAQDPGSSSQEDTEFLIHKESVQKRVVCSHTVVTGHDSQQETFYSKQGYIAEYLDPITAHSNGLATRQVFKGHLGHSGADEHEVHEGQLSERISMRV